MNRKSTIKLPIKVANMFADEILNLSDDEVKKESQVEFDDIDSEISNTRSAIQEAILKSKKSKLVSAREELDKQRNISKPNNIFKLPLVDKLASIKNAKESMQSLTLAARNEEEMSESDIDSMIQDLIDLGVIDEDGKIK